MFRKIAFVFIGLLVGFIVGYYLLNSRFSLETNPMANLSHKKEVLGFLPYWLLDKAKTDYSSYITNLDYFSLTIDKDGTILKSLNEAELEPGWYALTGGKADKFLSNAKQNNVKLSLTLFNGDTESINALMTDPIQHADNLMGDVLPIVQKYGFSEINLDIETSENADSALQDSFARFVKEMKKNTTSHNLVLSIDIIPVDFVKNDHLLDPARIKNDVDKVILMAYDFHSPSSFVTGPVAPLYGAGKIAEFDTQVSIRAALKLFSSDKIVLGIPFYGYSWETLDNLERAAIVPTTANVLSNKNVEDLLSNCATCSAQFDSVAQEDYIIYKNTDTNTFQQVFYPDEKSVISKINFVQNYGLSGLAIWALGYEGNNILNPIGNFLSNH